MTDGVLSRRQLIQSNKRKTKIDPGRRLHAVFANLKEDGLGIFPRSAHRVNDAETNLKNVVLQLSLACSLNSECVNVGLFGIEQVLHQEISVSSKDPGLLVVGILLQQGIKSVSGFLVLFLINANLGLGHEVAD